MFIAKQIPFELMESPIDETMTVFNDVIITGNKDFISYNNDIFASIDDEDAQYCYKRPEYFTPEEMVKILNEHTGRRYKYWTIRGCCQGEWNYLLYPDDTDFIEQVTESDIKQIESEYFNTGSQWDITDTETDDCYTVYVHDSDPSDKIIAQYIDCIPDEVEIHHFTGWKKIAQYD